MKLQLKFTLVFTGVSLLILVLFSGLSWNSLRAELTASVEGQQKEASLALANKVNGWVRDKRDVFAEVLEMVSTPELLNPTIKKNVNVDPLLRGVPGDTEMPELYLGLEANGQFIMGLGIDPPPTGYDPFDR